MKRDTLEVVGGVILGRVAGVSAVLAFRRKPEKAAGGRWEFPGGKVDGDETPQGALARELREELSVEAEVGQLVNRSSTVVGDRVINLSCYYVAVGELPVESTDHDRIEWVPVTLIGDLSWAEPDLPAVRLVAARWAENSLEMERMGKVEGSWQ